jgi:GR25 family glycosyltransferase involved in LPS biosynthesis
MSHTTLYKQLLEDPSCEYYIIFEDDAAVLPVIYDRIAHAINTAPSDWDVILFAPIMEVIKEESKDFKSYVCFWGLCGYAIRKKGAQKFVHEYNARPITMQIDSKMSLMIMQDNLHVYGYKSKVIRNDNMGTDIQFPVKPVKGINPFYIEDL